MEIASELYVETTSLCAARTQQIESHVRNNSKDKSNIPQQSLLHSN